MDVLQPRFLRFVESLSRCHVKTKKTALSLQQKLSQSRARLRFICPVWLNGLQTTKIFLSPFVLMINKVFIKIQRLILDIKQHLPFTYDLKVKYKTNFYVLFDSFFRSPFNTFQTRTYLTNLAMVLWATFLSLCILLCTTTIPTDEWNSVRDGRQTHGDLSVDLLFPSC